MGVAFGGLIVKARGNRQEAIGKRQEGKRRRGEEGFIAIPKASCNKLKNN